MKKKYRNRKKKEHRKEKKQNDFLHLSLRLTGRVHVCISSKIIAIIFGTLLLLFSFSPESSNDFYETFITTLINNVNS